MPHKIVYLTTGLAQAGAERQVMLLCEKFVRAGWDVGMISMLPPLAFEDELRRLGVPLMRMDLDKRFPDPRAFLRLVRTLRGWNPDVLHCHQVHANLIGRLARVFTDIPVLVCTAHNINEGPRWREWAYGWTDPLCDLTTNVCQAGVERYVRVGAAPAGKIQFMANGIEIDRFHPTAAQRAEAREALGLGAEFAWLAVANLREAKDYPTMLEAFRLVCKAKPGARLLIAGTGPLRQTLEREARDKGLGGVRFLGGRGDIPLLMAAADGFLISSAWEGTPLAVIEASASGLPVVATRVGGIPEVVADGESGIVVEPGDPAALARACLEVMNASPERRERFGSVGRSNAIAAFGIDTVVMKWQQIYTQLYRQTRKPSLERGMA